MKDFFKYIIIIITAATLSSCLDQYTICEHPKEVNFKGTFFSKSGNTLVETKVNTLSINLLDEPSFIYKNQQDLSSFIFGLNPLLDSAKYVFKINNALQTDTVTLFYTSSNFFISQECGSITIHNLLNAKTTRNTLDSVKINSSKIDNTNSVNLKLFF